MTVILDTPFSDTTAFSSTVGSPTIDAGSLLIETVAAAQYGQKIPGAGTRIVVAGFPYQLEAAPSSTSSLFVCNATVSVQLQARTGNKIRANCGATNSADSAVLSTTQWYWIDVLIRTDSATYSLAWSLDGVVQAGATVASTALDIANIRVGNTGTLALKMRYDSIYVTDVLADYPFGPPVLAYADAGYYP